MFKGYFTGTAAVMVGQHALDNMLDNNICLELHSIVSRQQWKSLTHESVWFVGFIVAGYFSESISNAERNLYW